MECRTEGDTFLHVILTLLWLFRCTFSQAASELIRNSLEPVLEQYKSLLLDSLKFSKLTLGTVAPQFTGLFSMQMTLDLAED